MCPLPPRLAAVQCSRPIGRMPRLRSSHFQRPRTVLRRPSSSAKPLRRPSAYTGRAESRESNRAHIRQGLPLCLRPTRAGALERPERATDAGPSVAEVARWTENKCVRYLESHGFYARVTRRRCWRCGQRYRNSRKSAANGQTRNPVLRCSGTTCDSRLYNSRFSLTPWYKSLRRTTAGGLTARQALQLLVCFTARIPLDSACTMVESDERSRRSVYEQVPRLQPCSSFQRL